MKCDALQMDRAVARPRVPNTRQVSSHRVKDYSVEREFDLMLPRRLEERYRSTYDVHFDLYTPIRKSLVRRTELNFQMFIHLLLNLVVSTIPLKQGALGNG